MKTPIWKAKKRFCAYRFFAAHNFLIPIEHTSNGYVAYVTANKFSSDSSANARLIAAAPEMLQALKDAIEHLGYHAPESFDDKEHEANWHKFMDNLLAVVNRAEKS